MGKLHFSIVLFFLFFYCNIYAQSETYTSYLDTARVRLSQGKCDKAESNYIIYKQMTGNVDVEFEKELIKCKENTVRKSNDIKSEIKLNSQKHVITNTSMRKSNEIHIGFFSGVSLANINSNSWFFNDANIIKTGFILGMQLEHRVTSNFSIQPELMIVQKGAYGRSYTSNYYVYTNTNQFIPNVLDESSITLNYIEMPLNININIPIVSNLKLFIGGGYSLSYGISGKATINPVKEGIVFNLSQDEKEIDFYDRVDPVLSRFDFSYNFFGGIQYKRYFIKTGYEWGENIAIKKRQGDYKYLNTCFALLFGVKL